MSPRLPGDCSEAAGAAWSQGAVRTQASPKRYFVLFLRIIVPTLRTFPALYPAAAAFGGEVSCRGHGHATTCD